MDLTTERLYYDLSIKNLERKRKTESIYSEDRKKRPALSHQQLE